MSSFAISANPHHYCRCRSILLVLSKGSFSDSFPFSFSVYLSIFSFSFFFLSGVSVFFCVFILFYDHHYVAALLLPVKMARYVKGGGEISPREIPVIVGLLTGCDHKQETLIEEVGVSVSSYCVLNPLSSHSLARSSVLMSDCVVPSSLGSICRSERLDGVKYSSM